MFIELRRWVYDHVTRRIRAFSCCQYPNLQEERVYWQLQRTLEPCPWSFNKSAHYEYNQMQAPAENVQAFPR